jgi:hypothetical protein
MTCFVDVVKGLVFNTDLMDFTLRICQGHCVIDKTYGLLGRGPGCEAKSVCIASFCNTRFSHFSPKNMNIVNQTPYAPQVVKDPLAQMLCCRLFLGTQTPTLFGEKRMNV